MSTLDMMPINCRKEAISEDIEQTVADMQLTIELGRVIRDRSTLPVKVPLRRLVVVCDSADRLAHVEAMKKYIVEVLLCSELALDLTPNTV